MASLTSRRAASRLFCVATHVNGNFQVQDRRALSLKSFGADTSRPELQKGVLRLYSMRFCPYAQRTRLVLEHKKIPYETVNIDLQHKPDWFLELNPVAMVPVLEKDGDVICESTATCEWLDEVYDSFLPRLVPTDPTRKAQDRALLEAFGGMAFQLRRIMFKPHLLEETIPKLKKSLQFYENALAKRDGHFFGGSNPAMLDFYLWPHFERVPAMAAVQPALAVKKDEFPQLAAWFEAMYQLPAVKATMFDIPSHLHFMKSAGEGRPDYDYKL